MPNQVRKPFLSFCLTALLTVGLAGSVYAAKVAKAVPLKAPVRPTVSADAPKADVQDVAAIKAMLEDLMMASNRHDIDAVLKHYSPSFISGDSLNLRDVRGLITDTWQMFPDIRYSTQTLEIRTNGNWATVESIDNSSATAKIDPTVSERPGTMKSRSRGLLYLHRLGKTWEILSDYTLYEKATILYGPFENIPFDIEIPEQVFAGESYTSKITVGVPAGNIAFATITQEPLLYPQRTSKDKFRTLSTDKTELERIFKANNTNNNEVITATIGFTEIGQDDQERPTINLKGVMTVVKRVNVIPKSTYRDVNPSEQVINTSANGKIHVDAVPQSNDDDDADQSGAPATPED